MKPIFLLIFLFFLLIFFPTGFRLLLKFLEYVVRLVFRFFPETVGGTIGFLLALFFIRQTPNTGGLAPFLVLGGVLIGISIAKETFGSWFSRR